MPLIVQQVYISYKRKILPLLLFYYLFYVYIFLVVFIAKISKHIFMHIKLKKLKLAHARKYKAIKFNV